MTLLALISCQHGHKLMNLKTVAMVLFSCCLCLFGCTGRNDNFINKSYTFDDVKKCVHEGSKKEDIVLHFGEPEYRRACNDGTEFWEYSIYPTQRRKGSGFGGFVVRLKNGKVVHLDPILTDY